MHPQPARADYGKEGMQAQRERSCEHVGNREVPCKSRERVVRARCDRRETRTDGESDAACRTAIAQVCVLPGEKRFGQPKEEACEVGLIYM